MEVEDKEMVQATIESFDNIRDFLFGFLRIATVVT
jgi:hypothetical protein